jgi:WD40 repeat protein
MDINNLFAVPTGLSIDLWCATTFSKFGVFSGHANQVSCCAFSPDNTRLASGSKDGLFVSEIILWDVISICEIKRFSNRPILYIRFSTLGDKLITGYWKCDIRIWDIETEKLVRRIPPRDVSFNLKPLICVTCNTSKIVANESSIGPSGPQSCWLNTWDYETCDLVASTKLPGGITCVSENPADDNEVAVGLVDSTVIIWDLRTQTAKLNLVAKSICDHLSFDNSGVQLYSCMRDDHIVIWDVSLGNSTSECWGLDHVGVEKMALSPGESNCVAIVRRGHIQFFNRKTGDLIVELNGYNSSWICYSCISQLILM